MAEQTLNKGLHCDPVKISNIRSQFLVYERRLFIPKMCPKFLTLDQFLFHLWPNQTFRHTGRQTFNQNSSNCMTFSFLKTFKKTTSPVIIHFRNA